MIALLATLALQSETEANALARLHDYKGALAVAARIEAPVERSRAEVEVRFQAGDLFGARRIAITALDGGAVDAVLALRAAELCTTLRDAEGARRALGVLEGALSASPPPAGQKDAWGTLLERRRRALTELEQRFLAGERALDRSRWIASSMLIFLAVAAVVLAWKSRPEPIRTGPGFPNP